ncbi:BTAD domain-containing putative transcriptional regulator [Oscillospiraceae bacterium 44-34]
MELTPLNIQMLGGFSIRQGDTELSIGGRPQKLCLLLSYLIWERSRPVSCGELIGLIWKDKPQNANSLNALKAILHRARICLDQLGGGTGRTLILSREGGYQWNPDQPILLDAEAFTQLCQKGGSARSEERRLELWTRALALYRGDFLPALAEHPWVSPITAQLHQTYLQVALDVLPLLNTPDKFPEAAELAGSVFDLEPYQEELCRWRMETLLRLERRKEAARTYEDFQERLLARLGVMPSDSLRELYREIQRHHDPRAVSPVTLLERLQEPPRPGALMCEYDFFRIVCHSMARMAGRSGEPIHIALISIQPVKDAPLPRHSLNRVMDHLQDIIRRHLRRGDTATRCSASQFVLLLPQATYENGQMICSRITRAFVRQFPHAPASLRVSVQPLPPGRPI